MPRKNKKLNDLSEPLLLLHEGGVVQVGEIDLRVGAEAHAGQADVAQRDGVLQQPLGAARALALVHAHAQVDEARVGRAARPRARARRLRARERAPALVRARDAPRVRRAYVQWLTWWQGTDNVPYSNSPLRPFLNHRTDIRLPPI